MININNKSGYAIISVIVVLVIIFAAVIYSGIFSGNNSYTAAVENENIILIRGFSVNSESAGINTSAKGTVFIRGSEGVPENVQIVAGVEIDPGDWGGVAFYIPDGCLTYAFDWAFFYLLRNDVVINGCFFHFLSVL